MSPLIDTRMVNVSQYGSADQCYRHQYNQSTIPAFVALVDYAAAAAAAPHYLHYWFVIN